MHSVISIWLWLFWICAGFVGYTYLGYPLCLWLLRLVRRPRPEALADFMPFLSIILTVRCEEANVGQKLEDILALDYPADRMEVWVASDGSTDRTNEIVGAFHDSRVHLAEYATRVGKAEAINRTVPHTCGEVLVLMDARQRLDREAVRALVRRFADPSVGVVGGEMVIVDREGNPTAEGTGLYWRLERWIRSTEAALEMLTGVSGCFFAIRKTAFRPIPPGSYCEDVTLVLYARSAGWKIRWETAARIYEQLRGPEVEFARKVRTLVGNYQLLSQFWPLYLPWRGATAFTLVSHKLSRLIAPIPLCLLLVSSAALAAHASIYLAALVAQAGLYALGLVGIASAPARRSRVANACGTFCLLNGAALLAFLHVIRHGPRIGWR